MEMECIQDSTNDVMFDQAPAPNPTEDFIRGSQPLLPFLQPPPPGHRIRISVGAQGSLQIWDAEDAIYLQHFHKISGIPSGCHPKVPVQDAFMSIPIRIMPEEAAFLRDEGHACFVCEQPLQQIPGVKEAVVFQTMREQQYESQVHLYRKIREHHLEIHRDELIRKAAWRNSRNKYPALGISEDAEWKSVRDDILRTPADVTQLFNIELPSRSWRVKCAIVDQPEVEFKYPLTQQDKIYFAAYSALRKAGFTITSGANYGADYLAFSLSQMVIVFDIPMRQLFVPGDSHALYSLYIVKVVHEDQGEGLDENLRLGRVATTAKKALLFATVSDSLKVRLCCSKWALMR